MTFSELDAAPPSVDAAGERADRLDADSRRERVLVTDGNERSALASVRALGESGYSVMTCSGRKRSLAGRSRFCSRSWTVSDPLSRPERYVGELASIVVREAIDVVLPVTEPSLLALLPERERLLPAVIPVAEYEKLETLLDKAEVLQRAPAHGIAVPKQVVVRDRKSARREAVADLRFPVVLKPGRSVGASDGERRSVGVTHVSERFQFESLARSQPSAAFPLLVQERIEGPGVGVFLLLDGDGVVARFAHRRLREKPPTGGVSVLRESIRPDETLFEKARSLLEDFGWEGVAMVEFKVREETGEPYLMEVNPRLWGSLQLAIDAGVDFPTLLVRSVLGESVLRRLEYEEGVRTRWLWGEVDHFLARLKSPTEGGEGIGGTIGRISEALSGFASGWGGETNLEVLRLSDPGPFLCESVAWCTNALTGRDQPGS